MSIKIYCDECGVTIDDKTYCVDCFGRLQDKVGVLESEVDEADSENIELKEQILALETRLKNIEK